MENNIQNLISVKEQELSDLRKYQELYEAEESKRYHDSKAENILSLVGTTITDIKLKRDTYRTQFAYCAGDITTLTLTLSNGKSLEFGSEEQLYIRIVEEIEEQP